MKKKYYAIKVGAKTGIFYDTWDVVSKLVKGYPKAVYKGFNSEEAAKQYLSNSNTTSTTTTQSKGKRKYYAITLGVKTGIFYDTWDNVKKYVLGTASEYKAFKDRESAEKYFNGDAVISTINGTAQQSTPSKASSELSTTKLDRSSSNLTTGTKGKSTDDSVNGVELYPKNVLVVYTDGSYNSKTNKFSWAFIGTKNGEEIYHDTGTNTPSILNLQNVSGEITAVSKALKWAKSKGYRKLIIRYDYNGLGNFESEVWEAKNLITQKFVREVKDYRNKGMTITFEKVKAHSGLDDFNARVDELVSATSGVHKKDNK